jgi:hypothetical protein
MIKTWNLVKIINKISRCTREKKGVLLLEGRWENVLGLINLREYEGICFCYFTQQRMAPPVPKLPSF